MENISNKENNEALTLTKQVFNILLDSIITHFKKTHDIQENSNNSQLYGFGNYDLEKPSLKKDLEFTLKGYVNGKYLYNKHREAVSGKPTIKINREYKSLYFNYLGFKGVKDFIESNLVSHQQKIRQQELLIKSGKLEDDYYVCYYFGENNRMNKGQVIIYNEWKSVEMIYVYLDDDGKKGIYTFHGTINQSENFAHFDTKYYTGNKKNEGANFIFFIGKSSPNERLYLVGTYSGFDKYDRAIAGKMIMKKYNSKVAIEEEVGNTFFDPIICQELNKNRLVVESNIRRNPLMFSKKSPFSQVLMKSSGDYIFEFNVEENVYQLKLKIEKYHYNIISLNDSVIIEDDRVSVINKGQILCLDFSLSGIFYLQKVSIYIKALDFMNKNTKGNFNGVDINNNIVSGHVVIISDDDESAF